MTAEELPADVQAELEDGRFLSMTHGKKPTYQKGCRGPLCKKAERDAARKRYRALHGDNVLTYPPRSARNRDALLSRIQEWHEMERTG